MHAIILTLVFLMNCYYLLKSTENVHTVLKMNNLISAWNLKIVLSVLVNCTQLRTALSETSHTRALVRIRAKHNLYV